jgi:hypothetical protein
LSFRTLIACLLSLESSTSHFATRKPRGYKLWFNS